MRFLSKAPARLAGIRFPGVEPDARRADEKSAVANDSA
jgi:hypothetical protein